MEYALHGDELKKARWLFSLLRHNWESGLADQGWLIGVDGEMIVVTEAIIDGGAGGDYGRILKVLAELEGQPRWQTLLPPEIPHSVDAGDIGEHQAPDAVVMSPSTGDMLRQVLLALKTAWEYELSNQGWRVEVDGEYRPATSELLAGMEYGHVLQVLAAMNASDDWQQLLPRQIRDPDLNKDKEVENAEVSCSL